MKTLFSLSICCMLLSFLAAPVFAAESSPEIKVEDIQVHGLPYAGTENAWFLVSCSVHNVTEKSGMVSVVLKTIDQWAYERKPLRLSGYVEAGKTARLSVLDFMDHTMFHRLRQYQIKSIELH